jgi:hypothetical protein
MKFTPPVGQVLLTVRTPAQAEVIDLQCEELAKRLIERLTEYASSSTGD